MRSFWMAGFEGADHVNMHGDPLDMVAITGHADDLDGDFARLAALGIRGVRESVGWRLAEPEGGGRFDFGRALSIARAAERHGIDVLWTLMHYGVPPDVSLMDDALVERFAAFAGAAARALAPWNRHAPVYTPINEISYLAWAACESNFIHPHVGERDDPRWRPLPDGFDVKRRLVRAQLAAMRSIRAEDGRARFLHIDPLVHVVAPRDATPELADESRRFRDFQWQAWDMIAGRLEPELGGSAEALDLLGLNHYETAQWEFGSGSTLRWPHGDERRLPLSALLVEAWQRYGRPLVVAETGHVGADRGRWIEEIAVEVAKASAAGVPVEGICVYPIVDRPDWNDTADWHRSGLWDAWPGGVPMPAAAAAGDAARHALRPGRHLDVRYAESLARCLRGEAALPCPDLPCGPTMKPTLLVFCHLRWDFVFQRPQHLLSRLAAHHRVIVVEEPVHDGTAQAWLERRPASPGVEVLRPRTPLASHGFADDQMDLIAPLVDAALRERGVERPIVWFYTPLALPLLDSIDARAVVFDCMDELSAFWFAPPALLDREARLLQRADLVLTGGPSLYEAKRHRAANVLCLPSSVDAAHFAPRPAGSADDALSLSARSLQDGIDSPRLGYFGVIDERMDLDLVAALADADPTWQIVMVGPVVKIEAAKLPRRPNLHWLGQQTYETLPRLVESWQVCLMPFALNESTRFISPTKTLEYLAAGKPVVSTAIRDVEVLYGEVVRIAATHEAFVDACRDTLAEGSAERQAKAARAAATVARYSWDETAARVEQALGEVLGASADAPPAAEAPATRGAASRSTAALAEAGA